MFVVSLSGSVIGVDTDPNGEGGMSECLEPLWTFPLILAGELKPAGVRGA